jgi:predicted GIY-YIG superfamily endonuclease
MKKKSKYKITNKNRSKKPRRPRQPRWLKRKLAYQQLKQARLDAGIQPSRKSVSGPGFVYLLRLTDPTNGVLPKLKKTYTYIGASTDAYRRLECHNGLRSGGPEKTLRWSRLGYEWKHICVVHGFNDYDNALTFETTLQKVKSKRINGPAEEIQLKDARGKRLIKDVRRFMALSQLQDWNGGESSKEHVHIEWKCPLYSPVNRI